MINRRKQLLLVLTSLSLLLGLSATAQEVRFTSTEFQDTPESKLQVSLQRLVNQSASGSTARIAPEQALTRRFDTLGNGSGTFPSLRMNDGNVQIVIETLPSTNLDALNTWIESRGGTVEVSLTEMVQATLPVADLESLSARDDISFVRLPVRISQSQTERAALAQGSVLSEGVEVIGSQTWNDAGLTGEGVKVGVIDQFGLYRSLMGSELPENGGVTFESFASHGEIFDPDGPEEFQSHGTSVSEIIFDIAPGASHHIAYFETLAEFFEASQWLIEDQEVDVVNTSLGFDSGCFRDGDGLLEPIFSQAKQAGITWTSASGNEGNIHLLEDFIDPDNDTRHNFAGNDEGNTIDALLTEFEFSNGDRVATAEFFAIYSWDAPCTGAEDNYELVLMREVNGVLEEVPSAQNSDQLTDWLFEPGRPIKFFFGFVDFDVARVGERETFHLGMKKINPIAEDVAFTVLHYGCVCFSIEYLDSEGSVGILEPGVSPNVVSVGAAHHALDCPTTSGLSCPDGRLLFYSSQGPTKDGRLKPEIAAPTHVTTATDGRWGGHSFSDNPGFTGTSAATPHVSGAAALVIQALREQGNDPTPDDVLDFLQTNAEDLGPTGFDNLYGAGLLTLGQPPC